MKKSLLVILFLTSFSLLHAQYQLRPVMVNVSPLVANLITITPGANNLKETFDGEQINPAPLGFGLGAYVPVFKPLWIGFSYGNSVYLKTTDETSLYNESQDYGDSSVFKYAYREFYISKSNVFSIGLLYRPGSLQKFISPYFKASFTTQLVKISGYRDYENGYYNITAFPYGSGPFEEKSTYYGNSMKFRNSGFTFGFGIDFRLSQNVNFNLIELSASNLSGKDSHAVNIMIRTGVNIFLLKQK